MDKPQELKQIPQGAKMVPPTAIAVPFQSNASSTYQNFLVTKALDANPNSYWESDYSLYKANGDFDSQLNVPYKSALNMTTLDYPTFSQPIQTLGEWIQVKFASPVGIAGYAITVPSDTKYAPSSWKLLVSYPEIWGNTWYAVHLVQNETRWASTVNRTIYYEIPSEISGYSLPIYRLVVTKTNGGGYVRISDLSFNVQNVPGTFSRFVRDDT